VTLVLKDEIDISRGDLLVDAQKRWRRCRALPLMWCGWLNSR
jgi:sulfate adenylyltransferase subunit 1 (EFTu-like GTPase family)